jgi:hypothetical protein
MTTEQTTRELGLVRLQQLKEHMRLTPHHFYRHKLDADRAIFGHDVTEDIFVSSTLIGMTTVVAEKDRTYDNLRKLVDRLIEEA